MLRKISCIGGALAVSVGLLGLAACSTGPSMPSLSLTTGSVTPSPKPAQAAKPAKRVVAAKAAKMYVWNAFMEKDCRPIEPALSVTQAPARGKLSFKPNESVVVQHSISGKCVGQRMAGTGIYYTPAADQQGMDRFAVTATTPSGQTSTKTFTVEVVQ